MTMEDSTVVAWPVEVSMAAVWMAEASTAVASTVLTAAAPMSSQPST